MKDNIKQGLGSIHQYSQYRRIMTADNAGVGGAMGTAEAGRRRRVLSNDLNTLSGQSAHMGTKALMIRPNE